MARDVRQEGLFFPGADAAAEAERRAASQNPGADVPIPVRRGFWSRRTILRFVGWGAILGLVGQWSVGFGSFFWPKKVGAFGGELNTGAPDALQVGDVKDFQEGKFFLTRVPEGLLALYKKCPHLGCTVPWKAEEQSEDTLEPKGRFHCPCHGSIYDRYGKIISGPAPRPMDLFGIAIRDGKVYIDTNPTKATQRSIDETREPYPKGPTPIS